MKDHHERSRPCCGGHKESRREPSRSLYFCPMCPEVNSDRPGVCPRCGMALERNPLLGGDELPAEPELLDFQRRLWVSVVFTLPVFILAMAPMVSHFLTWMSGPAAQWSQFLLSLPVVLWCGYPIWTRGWLSIRSGQLNMFTLVALGVGTAFLWSIAAPVSSYSDVRARTRKRTLLRVSRRHHHPRFARSGSGTPSSAEDWLGDPIPSRPRAKNSTPY